MYSYESSSKERIGSRYGVNLFAFFNLFFFSEKILCTVSMRTSPLVRLPEKKSPHTSVGDVKTLCACTRVFRVKNVSHIHGRNDFRNCRHTMLAAKLQTNRKYWKSIYFLSVTT